MMHRDEILRAVQARISGKRLAHTLGVEQSAVRLAGQYGANPDDASAAALLHDMCRNLSLAQMLEQAEQSGLPVSDYERAHPIVLHGPLAALEAQRLGIRQADVLAAVRTHTVGAPQMNLLQKIIFISDAIEDTRGYPGVGPLRVLAGTDLTACVLAVLEQSVEYLKAKGVQPHPDTLAAIAYYKRQGDVE